MKQTRQKIDAIDKKLIALLVKRTEFVMELGEIKKQKNLLIEDKNREMEILAGVQKLAEKHGLNPQFIKKLYAEIIKESKRIQSHEK